MKNKILVFLLVFVTVFGFSANAASSYKSYVYDNNGETFEAPDAFYFDKQYDLVNMKDNNGKPIGMLYPHDIFVADNGLIYVSGDDEDEQGMVLILNSDYSFNSVIKSFQHTIKLEDGTTKTFKDRFGSITNTFVDKNSGSIFICDLNGATPENSDFEQAKNINVDATSGRVIKLNANFEQELVICGITNEILPSDFSFQPKKIVVDNYGRIFVLSQGFTMGIMELDSEGEFVQCIGAPSVTYNPIELLWRAISTDAQKEAMEDYVPTEYSGIEIDAEGFIYVTNSTFDKSTYEDIDCLSRLNAKGNNVLRTAGTNLPYGDTDASWRATLEGASKLVDIKSLDYGNYAVLDSLRGKVFFYNTDGVNLFEFGTVADDPDDDHITYIEGNLDVPVALEWHNDQCVVLDSELHCINTYSMTAYARKIIEASRLHELDLYDDEIKVWKEVLALNNNSVAAKQNIAKVFYRDGDWQTAMKYFKEIKDQENYSKAYKYQRQEYINDYFTVAVAVIVALIILIVIFGKWRKNHKKEVKEDSLWAKIKFAKKMMFRPLHSSWILARENKGSVPAATIILIAVSIMSVLQARYTGFIFDAHAEDVNIIAEIATIVLPVLLFSVCNWCVTSLMAGEGSFKAIYMSTCYSLTPILFLYPIAILLSNIMVLEEGDFYSVFISIALIWVFAWIFFSNMRIHDYTLGMAVIEILITVVVMLLIVFLAILFMALVQQMYSFVVDIIDELATR
ncbi:MAG: hypothetical protein ACI39F_01290 [Acutalibacteraceae bacterium]